jgi:hypothetical protein
MAIIPSDEKVFMVDKRTNTIYGGSAALQAMQQWYTMQDVIDSIQPYKVFTALLTQSGGDEGYVIGQSDPIHLGVTYTINSNPDSFDLMQYGSPNNNVGTSFVCNVESVLPNEIDVALAWNAGAPLATVLENTIGNVWFTYSSSGRYIANSNNLFINNKTIFNGDTYYEANNASVTDCISDIENNTISTISVWSFSRADSATIDSTLNNTPIEIRVYN